MSSHERVETPEEPRSCVGCGDDYTFKCLKNRDADLGHHLGEYFVRELCTECYQYELNRHLDRLHLQVDTLRNWAGVWLADPPDGESWDRGYRVAIDRVLRILDSPQGEEATDGQPT